MFMLPACAPKKPPAPQPAPVEQPLALPGDFDEGALNSALSSLDAAAASLPGRGAQAHREAMAASFSAIVDTLIIFEGSEPSWAFQREATTMQTSRDRLVAETTTTMAESAIDAGLRAAYSAVNRLAGTEELSDPAIAPWLEKLKNSADAYGETPSVGKAFIAADAVNSIAMISRAMANRLAPPVNAEEPPTSASPTTSEAPATAPAEPEPAAEVPTTEPAASPAAAETPTTEPAAPPAADEAPTTAPDAPPIPAEPPPAPDAIEPTPPAAPEDVNK